MKKLLSIVACVAVLVLTIQAIGAEKIIGGPFAVGVTQRNATLVWLVQTDEAVLRPATAAGTSRYPSLRVEKTTLTGLQPNTRFDYELPANGETLKGSFKTAPVEPVPYRFVLYGDTRTRHDVHRNVISEVMKHALPDFILHTGDLVADGNDSAQWPIFFDVERDLLRQTAFFPSLGNHERNTRYFQELFQRDSTYYSFDWGNGHFAVLDSDIANVGSTERERSEFWARQTQWLEDDLKEHQTAEYRFVIAHHPPFTAVARRQGDNPHMTALVPMFEKYHVTAALFGHDHNYQHYLKNGIHYVITGGGGAPLYDVDKPAEGITLKAASIENFVSVDVNGEIAHFKAISIDGKTIEEFDVKAANR